jgi:osmotically-inducible protein OsmY
MKTNYSKWLSSISPQTFKIAASCGAILASSAMIATAETTGPITDNEITNAIESAMLFETSVPNHLIDITVTKGVATLNGTVTNLLARERAIKSAKAVRGVRAVVDELKLDLPEVPDETVKQNVRNALVLDAATDAYEVAVEVNDGKVTLAGAVESWHEKKLVTHVVKSARGVREIDNQIEVDLFLEREDPEMAAEVRRLFEIDVILRSLLIDVSVTDDVVYLEGTVGSIAERERAVDAAWVRGVKNVDAQKLNVDSWADSNLRKNELPALKDDEKIKAAVLDAFAYDPRVFSFNPDVTVDNGVVTLAGTVDNLKAKRAAERDAMNTVGVWRVQNFLKVRTPEPISDDTIISDLKTALALNTTTESYEIDVEVEDGIATLKGTVDSYLEKNEATDIASRTNGVIVVRNKLEVEYPEMSYYSYTYDPLWNVSVYYGYNTLGEPTWPAVSDAEIIEEIEDEFFWSPFVDSDDINIAAKFGEITLTGNVEDYNEFRAATENAYEGGAKDVINKLTVK